MRKEIFEEMKLFLDSATPEQISEDFEEMKGFEEGPKASEYTNDTCQLMRTSRAQQQFDASFVMLPNPATANKHFSHA